MTWSRSWPPDPAGPHTVAPVHGRGAGRGAAGVRPARDRQPAAGHQPVHLHPGRAGGPAGKGGSCGRCRTWRRRKLQRRQQALAPEAFWPSRAGLASRAVTVSRGNPGLQDLIGLRLVYGAACGPGAGRGGGRGHGSLPAPRRRPADADVREFLENLALDSLLDEAGPSSLALLRAVTVFDLPVPAPVIDRPRRAGGRVGGAAARPGTAGALSRPVRPGAAGAGRRSPGRGADRPAQPAMSRPRWPLLTAAPLFAAWGGTGPRPGRGLELDLQLTRLALLADDPAIVAACAA